MRLNQRYLIMVIFLMLCGFFATGSAVRAQSNSYLKLDATRVSWTRLSFQAKNFWVAVSTDIQMKSLPASDLAAVLLASPKGTPIRPLTPQINEMTINTTIAPRSRSPVKIHNRIWFNPTNAAAIGRIRIRRGEDDFKKMYRFTDQGVFRHRIEPKNSSEARLEPGKSTDLKDSVYPYDLNQLTCPGVSDCSALFFILSAFAMSFIDSPLPFCVVGIRLLHGVRLQHEGFHPINVD